MKISILTLFPQMFVGPFDHSILKRAQEKKALELSIVNIRDFGISKHKIVDDKPYGGGVGMILRVDVIDKALTHAKCAFPCKEHVILLDPQGKQFIQTEAKKYTRFEHLIFICGHYEGVDERVRDMVDEEISIGDYILTGGEIPAMVVVDAVARLLPFVLKKSKARAIETFENNLLEFPQYTRPQSYKEKIVPDVLLSGNHKKVDEWRNQQARKKTAKRRPDLLKS